MSNRAVNQYTPEIVAPPGETLSEMLESRGLSQAELAGRMGRPKKTINELVKGKAAITPDTALQLERVLGVPASFWNNLEQNYRDFQARMGEERRLAAASEWLRIFPLKDMCKLGWVVLHQETVEQVKELLNFFGIASPDQWELAIKVPQAAFRRSAAFQVDSVAVATWLRAGYRRATEIECAPFNAPAFRSVLGSIRSLSVEPPQVFVPELRARCAAVGVAVVFVPPLPRTRVFAATRWLSAIKAVIQLSLRYKSNDHLWFSFFHEAGHIILHGKRDVFLEVNGSEADSKEEVEANRFAANMLIPESEYSAFVAEQVFQEQEILAFASRVGIAPGIVVGRLQYDKLVPYQSRLNTFKVRYDWAN